MSDESRDPSGDTEAFRAFVRREEPAPATRPVVPLIVAGVVVVALALGVVLILALR